MSNEPLAEDLTIRPARPQDAPRLERLAALDSTRVPAGELLVAESGGRLLAAVSLADGRVIADPFTPTADPVGLLRARRLQLRAASRWDASAKRAGAPEPADGDPGGKRRRTRWGQGPMVTPRRTW